MKIEVKQSSTQSTGSSKTPGKFNHKILFLIFWQKTEKQESDSTTRIEERIDREMLARVAVTVNLDMSIEELVRSLFGEAMEACGASHAMFFMKNADDLTLVAHGSSDDIKVTFWHLSSYIRHIVV